MITLICGLSRAGKTTYSQKYQDTKIIHLDNYGSYQRVRDIVKYIDTDVVVDGIYWNAEDRKQLIRAYSGNGAKCVWIDTPKEIRQTRKGYRKWSEHRFDPPTVDEGWNEILIIRQEN